MADARRVAVVTGGARGIGLGCARALAARGFDLALVDVLAEALEGAAAELRAAGASALPLVGDVSDFARTQALGAEIVAKLGRVDVLVNNAGVACSKGLLDITEAEWDRTVDINLKGCFNWCRAVAPAMLERGAGRIVNISSVSAHSGGVTTAVSKFAYAASKAGILGLTRGLAKELAPAVTVNAVLPGAIVTDLTAATFEKRAADLTAGIALRRFGSPEDIAEVVAFLATVEPNFVTGQALTVDGFQWSC